MTEEQKGNMLDGSQITLTREEIDAANVHEVPIVSEEEKREYRRFVIAKIESDVRDRLRNKHKRVDLTNASVGNHPFQSWRGKILEQIAAEYNAKKINALYDNHYFSMTF